MEGWTLFFMVVVLKIPLVAALFIIWYAIKAEPVTDDEGDSGHRGPRRNPPRLPRPPRRPAGGVACRPSPCPQLDGAHPARPAPALTRRG
jgi:hypothetical protein